MMHPVFQDLLVRGINGRSTGSDRRRTRDVKQRQPLAVSGRPTREAGAPSRRVNDAVSCPRSPGVSRNGRFVVAPDGQRFLLPLLDQQVNPSVTPRASALQSPSCAGHARDQFFARIDCNWSMSDGDSPDTLAMSARDRSGARYRPKYSVRSPP